MDALLKALFSQFNTQAEPFGSMSPEQLLAGGFGPLGAVYGTPQGMWGSMFGDFGMQVDMPNPMKAMAPSDPLLAAILHDSTR